MYVLVQDPCHHYLCSDSYVRIALYWEGGPPTDVADHLNVSVPILFDKIKSPRLTKDIAEADK